MNPIIDLHIRMSSQQGIVVNRQDSFHDDFYKKQLEMISQIEDIENLKKLQKDFFEPIHFKKENIQMIAFNHYTVKRKGKVIKGETKRNRNAAKRERRSRLGK